MPFLSGSLSFERFQVEGFESSFDNEQIEVLQNYVAGNVETASSENTHVGFLGGTHVFDQEFDLGKNWINDALHIGVRIDTNQVPSVIRKAWLQIELAALAKESPSGQPTKAQKKEAKEAVEERCIAEAATGKYRKMQSFPLLWDFRQSLLYFGGSAGNASSHCADLLERAFQVQLSHVSAGSIAQHWATDADRVSELDDLTPALFVPGQHDGSFAWNNEHSQAPDFLGNEFLMWLWWTLENRSDTIVLPDSTEAIVMMNKALALECPRSDSGKETISAEAPTQLPEAMRAIQSGKLPRKSGLTIVRDGQRYDLVLQAESFAISGAKIHLDEDDDFQVGDRIDAIRGLSDTVDSLFHVFCEVRTGEQWDADLSGIHEWLKAADRRGKKAAA